MERPASKVVGMTASFGIGAGLLATQGNSRGLRLLLVLTVVACALVLISFIVTRIILHGVHRKSVR